MNWIVAGLLMTVSSVVMYLLVRKSALLKTPTQLVNLSMFLLPATLLLVLSIIGRIDLTVSWYEFGVLVVLALFFSYLGNVASLKSIEYAPNPGYSLVLSKSYVVFTTLIALPLFHATLTARSVWAIALIIASSAMLTISSQKDTPASHVRASWLPLSILAFFCWGMITITSKYLLELGVGIFPRLIYSMVIVSLITAAEMRWKKIRVSVVTKSQAYVLAGIGLCSVGFNYFMQVGFVTAPNIGYINAMNAASIGLVVIGSAVFFKDEFSLRKFVGVLGVIAGLVLLVL